MRELVKFILNNWVIVLSITVSVLAFPFIAAKYFPNNSIISTVRQVFKIVLTNRINLFTIFIAVFIAIFIFNMVNAKFALGEALFGATYLVLGYGIMFWTGFIFCVLVLDIVLFSFYKEPQYTTYKLAIEWFLISLPFIYWIIRYNQWIFLAAVLAFLLGQYLRRPHIIKILE